MGNCNVTDLFTVQQMNHLHQYTWGRSITLSWLHLHETSTTVALEDSLKETGRGALAGMPQICTIRIKVPDVTAFRVILLLLFIFGGTKVPYL